MQDFILRVAGQDDAAAVTAVLTSAFRELAADYDPAVLAAALPAMTIAKPALLASGLYYVQELRGGGIVSCGGWTHTEPGTNAVESGVAHVRHFGTHADWLRKGLGTGIFNRCRQEAIAAGIHTLKCLSSLGAETFYASLGFQPVERTELVLGGALKFPAIAMIWTTRTGTAGSTLLP